MYDDDELYDDGTCPECGMVIYNASWCKHCQFDLNYDAYIADLLREGIDGDWFIDDGVTE